MIKGTVICRLGHDDEDEFDDYRVFQIPNFFFSFLRPFRNAFASDWEGGVIRTSTVNKATILLISTSTVNKATILLIRQLILLLKQLLLLKTYPFVN
jgi:hypothetical protein